MAIGLVGKRVRLVPVDLDKHLDTCFEWVNDAEITRTLSFGAFPISRLMEREVLERLAKGSTTDVVWAIELIETGEHIGMSGIHNISMVNRSAVTGTIIGRKDLYGQGLATEAIELRSRYCFHTLNLRVLYSEYHETNVGSAKMQEKAGYKIWGVKPKADFIEGRHHDLVQTVLFREDWERLNGWG